MNNNHNHWCFGFHADYLDNHWQIHQFIQSLGFYNLEGDFDVVMNFLQNKKVEVEKIYLNECTIREQNCVPELRYRNNVVIFDKLNIVYGTDGEGSEQLQIWGYRKPNSIELEWLESSRLNQESLEKEERKKQLAKLQEEFR